MGATLFLIGIILGASGLLAVAYFTAKKDNQKYDTSSSMNSKDEEPIERIKTWPDGYVTDPEAWKTTWKTTRVTEYKTEEKREKKKTLEEQLNEALAIEDYETAAKLRDKINKNKK